MSGRQKGFSLINRHKRVDRSVELPLKQYRIAAREASLQFRLDFAGLRYGD
jgi:hypothetical protein